MVLLFFILLISFTIFDLALLYSKLAYENSTHTLPVLKQTLLENKVIVLLNVIQAAAIAYTTFNLSPLNIVLCVCLSMVYLLKTKI